MKIIIVGDGKVGATLTEHLSKEGHDVVVIDQDPQVVEEMVNQYDVMGISGNGASYSVLMEAGANKANLLIAADCTAYAYGNFHNQFIKNHVVLIGCPKLDAVDYTEKLTEIIKHNDFKSLTIVRMEVPCCGGLEHAATEALKASGKFIPWQVVTIGINGTIKDI